jgi:crotonobetainyl-CoA:carnitine CoA-transferase CaiB-like acyl-CoA transferase
MAATALGNLQVLDLSHLIAGPYCTRLLGGFGASVLKIERPPEGDPARGIGPFLNDLPGVDRSLLFLYLNSNKKSITLNLKSEAGLRIVKQLVAESDVLVESFKPGVMKRLGLDYPSLKLINPGLVMASISNFGQNGPYSNFKSSHLITWAMSVGMYTPDGPGSRPLQIGGWITHYIAGLFAAAGIATAAYQRRKLGHGQHVDTSMQESIMMMGTYPSTVYAYSGLAHFDIGGRGVGVVPTKDGGYIGPSVWTPVQMERMFAMLGIPEMSQDPRFQPDTFVFNRPALKEIIAEQALKWNAQELFETAIDWNVPFAMLPDAKSLLDSPQLKARQFFEQVKHPVIGKALVPGSPFKMSETPWKTSSPAPLLGQHNEEVLCGRLAYSKDDLPRLRELGVI